jgi:tetratricopeptide (TPR) repeat protein
MKINNECPQCGANSNSENSSKCEYCGSLYVFQSLSDFATAPDLDFGKALQFFRKSATASDGDDDSKFQIKTSLGLCYLKQKAFPLALSQFSKLIDEFPEQPKPYIYKVLAMLAGKKPRISSMKVIQEINGMLNMAHVLGETNGQALALLAVIEYDYYERNGLKLQNPSPFELIENAREEGMSFDELLASIDLIGLREEDVEELV